jgi:hypothetical protein
MSTYLQRQKKNRITSDLSAETLRARKAWKNISSPESK